MASSFFLMMISFFLVTLLINNSQFQNDSNTILLLHFNGTHQSTSFYDDGNVTFTPTANGNAQIVTNTTKLNGSAGFFDGSGDFLSIADNDLFDLGSNDFTIEFWTYPTSAPGGLDIISKRNDLSFGGFIVYQAEANYIFYATSNDAAWDICSAMQHPMTLHGTSALPHLVP